MKEYFLIILVLVIFSLIIFIPILADEPDIEASYDEVVVPEEITPEVVAEPMSEIETEKQYIFYDVPFSIETQKEIINICSEYDIRYELILGMIYVESRFNAKTTGDGGDSLGLMQIQPKWWSGLMEREGVTDLFEPLQNIRCGCAILRELQNKYGTEYRALQAYNTGNPDSTVGYADRVYSRIGELKEVKE